MAGLVEESGLGVEGVPDDSIGDGSCVSGNGCIGGGGNPEGAVEDVCQAWTADSEVVGSAPEGGEAFSSAEFTGSSE